MRVGDRRLDLVSLSQHAVGAHELDPARDVGSVLLQTLRQPFDHCLDGVAVMLRGRGRQCRWGRGRSRGAGSGLGLEPLKTAVQALQGFRIAGQRGMRVGDRRLDLVGLSQHAVGAHELDPARDIGSVLLQTFGKALDHRFNGAVVFRRRDRCRRGRGNGRWAFLVDPRHRILDQRQPLGALAGARNQRVPPLHRLVAAALLLGAEPEIILRHHVFAIGGFGAGEQVLGFRGHHAVRKP